jgi:hypothetical protein
MYWHSNIRRYCQNSWRRSNFSAISPPFRDTILARRKPMNDWKFHAPA